MGGSVRGVSQVAAAAMLWGTWGLFLRPTGLPGVATAPFVLLITGLGTLVLVRVEGVVPRWDGPAWRLLLLYALLDAINVGAFFAAMEQTTIAVAVLTHCTAPVVVALLAPRLEGTRVRGSLVAAVTALVGLALLLRPWEYAEGSVALGAMFGLVSASAYAGLVFVLQPLTARVGVGRATSYHALLAALLLFPFAAPHLDRIEATDVALLGMAGMVPGALAVVLFIDGLRRIGSARASVLSLLEPMVAVLIAWIVWDEALAPTGALGAALVLGAALWVARGDRV